LQAKKAKIEEREYGKRPLSENELREIIGDSPIEKFLNTRTPLYRERNMKQKPPFKEEAIKLMLKAPGDYPRKKETRGFQRSRGKAVTLSRAVSGERRFLSATLSEQKPARSKPGKQFITI
jgi:hypothetical protein